MARTVDLPALGRLKAAAALLLLQLLVRQAGGSAPRRGCRVAVDAVRTRTRTGTEGETASGPHVYWRLTPEECEAEGQDGPQRRALLRPDAPGDCGEVHRWLAKWKPTAEAEFRATCDAEQEASGAGALAGAPWRCFRNFIGLVQAIDADDCAAGAYIARYAELLEVVERDAEDQLVDDDAGQEGAAADGVGGDGGMRRLLQAPVELNGLMDRAVPWYLDRIDQRYRPLDGMYTYSNDASKVTIYVLDTGVDPDHEQFLTNVGGTSRVAPGYSARTVSGGSVEGRDCNGHGTGCASVAAGLWYGAAKGAAIVPVSVTDCRGRGTQTDILDGLAWIAANLRAPAVLSMSLGTAASDALDAAVLALINRGLVVVAAAGNSGVDACQGSPGRVPGVITVAAADQGDARWISPSGLSSNYGSCVDIFAPGQYFTTAGIGSPVAQQGLSGTSVAAPLVTGVVAQILHAYHPYINPNVVSDTIKVKATPGAVSGVNVGTTASMINSWRVIEDSERELQPYLLLEQMRIPPPPPLTAAPTPAPTPAPTTPAPTLPPGALIAVRQGEEALTQPHLLGAGVTWHASAFGLPVLGTAGCWDTDIRLATAALAGLLDADDDGEPDTDELLSAMASRNATLLLYATAAAGDAVLDRLPTGTVVVGLLCQREDELTISQRSGLAAWVDGEAGDAGAPLLLTVESPEAAALALAFLAGYAELWPARLGWRDRGSELWAALSEANQDCGFTEPAMREDFGWSPYCTGIFSVYDETCGASCVAARYFELALYALLDGLPTNIVGACPQRGIKWDTCTADMLEEYNPTGFALLSDVSLGLPTALLTTAYYGAAEVAAPATSTPTPASTPTATPALEDVMTTTPEPTTTPSAPTTTATSTDSMPEPDAVVTTTPVPAEGTFSKDMTVLIDAEGGLMELVSKQADFLDAVAASVSAPASAASLVALGTHGGTAAVYGRVRLSASTEAALNGYIAALEGAASNGGLATALWQRAGLRLHNPTGAEQSPIITELDDGESDSDEGGASPMEPPDDADPTTPMPDPGSARGREGDAPPVAVLVSSIGAAIVGSLLLAIGGVFLFRNHRRRQQLLASQSGHRTLLINGSPMAVSSPTLPALEDSPALPSKCEQDDKAAAPMTPVKETSEHASVVDSGATGASTARELASSVSQAEPYLMVPPGTPDVTIDHHSNSASATAVHEPAWLTHSLPRA